MNKIFIALIFFMTIFMTVATYHRIFIRGDYIIKMEADCDPQKETCLIKSTEDGEPIYYKIIEQKASNL